MDADRMKRLLAKAPAYFRSPRGAHPAPAGPRTQSWAQLIRSCEEVPKVYRAFFDALPASETDPFPYTVLTPAFKGVRGKPERERLACIVGAEIHLLERIEDRFACTSYRLGDIAYIESGVILLYSWITIHGLSD